MTSFYDLLVEAIKIDDVNTTPGKEKVVVFQGRFQPFTKAHLAIIKQAHDKYHCPVAIFIVKGEGSDKSKNPFPLEIQEKMMKMALPFKTYAYVAKSGFIGDFIHELREAGKEPVAFYCGQDREASYGSGIERYKDRFNLNMKLEVIPRTDEDISASKLRAALKDDNEETFKAMADEKTWKMYKELQKYIKPKLNESMKSGTFNINMTQFRKNWKHDSDNVHYAEKIEATKGKFLTMDAQRYIDLLNDFNIFYTLKQ